MITSILDTDLYKFSMQQAVLELYPDAQAEYRFTNRGTQRFPKDFDKKLRKAINDLSKVSLTSDEATYLSKLSFFKPQYVAFLRNYQFDPSQVRFELTDDSNLELSISGPWHQTILWEVPLMAIISELYFQDLPSVSRTTATVSDDAPLNYARLTAYQKTKELARNGCLFAEFGTRRRRSKRIQEEVLIGLCSAAHENGKQHSNLVGTSNVRLAMERDIKPIGTMAHEFIMAVSVLEGLRHANRFALYKWKDVYKADLGIALTDTFGSAAFWEDFDLELAKVYDGVRHDSGDPIVFGDATIAHYKKLGIDPKSKTIIFSDGLNVDKAIKIREAFTRDGRPLIKVAFGIGTNLTNDFPENPALNMVIKLRKINEISVIKLSDEPGKETGNPSAIKVAKWTFKGEPL